MLRILAMAAALGAVAASLLRLYRVRTAVRSRPAAASKNPEARDQPAGDSQ